MYVLLEPHDALLGGIARQQGHPPQVVPAPPAPRAPPVGCDHARVAQLPASLGPAEGGRHRVDGVVVLPSAAYVSKAIEAVRLVTNPSEKDTRRYRVRDVEFRSALTIPESLLSSSSSSGGSVETHLRLQPCHGDDYAGWYEFDVRSLGANDVWVENCRGLVSAVVDPKDVDDAVIPDAESFLDAAGSSKKGGTKVRHMDGAALRAHVAEMGVEYGPAFQGLTDGRASTANNRAATNLRVNALESEESEEAESAAAAKKPRTSTLYVIHPTTLDCIVQATYTNLPSGTG